ncbi:hypothetical protein V8C35DRAFT_46676 [Trichoderma chlorosporum]
MPVFSHTTFFSLFFLLLFFCFRVKGHRSERNCGTDAVERRPRNKPSRRCNQQWRPIVSPKARILALGTTRQLRESLAWPATKGEERERGHDMEAGQWNTPDRLGAQRASKSRILGLGHWDRMLPMCRLMGAR